MPIYGPRVGKGLFASSTSRLIPEQHEPDDSSLPPLPDNRSLFKAAADNTLGGLSAAGNLLDLPASSVRDLMTWVPGGIPMQNPLDQWLSPFSDRNRVTGEQMLQSVGALGTDKSPGLGKSLGRFAAGMGLEIALDPLTYLTFGASALGKGGKLAKAAGLLDDASLVAGRKIGSKSGRAGKRYSRMNVSARELIENANAHDAAIAAFNGMNPKLPNITSFDQIPAELLDESLGGLARWKLPFREGKILGGKKAVSAAAAPQRDRVAAMATAVFGDRSPETLSLMDAHAKLWSKKTGKEADEWFTKVRDIKSTDAGAFRGDADTLFQSAFSDDPKMPEGFFSKLDTAVATKIGGKTNAEQFFRTMKNAGVTSEELEDLELQSLFARNKTPTKADIQAHIDDNRVELEFVSTTSQSPSSPSQITKNTPVFEQHTVPGGIDNSYREVRAVHRGKGKSGPDSHPQFASGHFAPDTLFHMRLDDVPIPGSSGKALRVQEIQSDWLQTGRADGFQNKLAPEQRLELESLESRRDALMKQRQEGLQERFVDLQEEYGRPLNFGEIVRERRDFFRQWNEQNDYPVRKLHEQITDIVGVGTVPDAPFKKSWPKLALKEILRTAAKEGYDEVQIVKGEDIATSVGGPRAELSTFYDKILHNDLKKMTKRWDSFQGITENIVDGWDTGFDAQVFKVTDKMRRELLDAGQTLYQTGKATKKGAVQFGADGKAIIHAFGAADLTTFVHETAHVFRRSLADVDDKLLREAENALGVESRNWTREAEEAFAKGFEEFVASGKAPSSRLEEVFVQFRDWMKNLYHGIRGTKPESVNPSLDSVFKQMLDSGEAKPWLPGDASEKLAITLDRTGEFVGESAPIRAVKAVFSAPLRKMKTRYGQQHTPEMSKRIDEMRTAARDNAFKAIRVVDDKGWLAGDSALENSLAMSDYLEGLTDELPGRLGPEAKSILDSIRHLTDDLADKQIAAGANLHPLKTLGYVKQVVSDADGNEVLRDIPSPVDYAHRQRQLMSGPVFQAIYNKRRAGTIDPASLGRADYTRHMPTSSLQRMSIDKDFAGINDKGAFGFRGKLDDWFKGDTDAGHLKSKTLSKQFKDAKWKHFQQKYDPFEFIDPEYLDDDVADAITKQHRALFESIIGLDRKQVEAGVPMFAINPAENFLGRMESGMESIAANVGVRSMVANAARPIGSKKDIPIEGTDLTDLNTLVENMDIKHDVGKRMLVEELGQDAVAIRQKLTSKNRRRMLGDTKVADRIVQDLNDVIAINGVGIDDKELLDILRKRPDDLEKLLDSLPAGQRYEARKIVDSVSPPPKDSEILEGFEIDANIGQDMAQFNKGFSGPEETNAIWAAWDAFTNLFKGNVTAPFPSFHVRNAGSAFAQNSLNGIHDPRFSRGSYKAYLRPYQDSWKLIGGKDIGDAATMPFAKLQGLTEKEANEQIRQWIFSRGLVDSPGSHNDILGATHGHVANQILGHAARRGEAAGKSWLDLLPAGKTIRGMSLPPEGMKPLDRIKPWKASGVSGGGDAFVGQRYGRAVGNVIEQSVRTAPFIALLRAGVDPDEAARMVKRLQIDYSDLTDIERKWGRRFVPFYSFQKGATKYLASELAQRPGGPVAMTIKAAENASGNDPGTPEYIREGLNIPISVDGVGPDTYLTGGGLMHEPPLQILGNGIQATGFNLGRLLHPIPKAALETVFDESLFMEGPGTGGRSLDDLDPLLGRTMSNVTNALGITDREAPFRTGKLTEVAIANSPLSKYLNVVRKATDPRRSMGIRGLDLLTGTRTSVVDDKARDAVLREQLETLMREMGGRQFSQAYLPDYVRETLNDDDLTRAAMIERALKEINTRRRSRNKERKLQQQ